ncbi:MAG: hypothetical protein GY696_16010 [Gammaproteobacteria bacterium]|nr:hypothetical protein [Gammaproteobacteria bacterium]
MKTLYLLMVLSVFFSTSTEAKNLPSWGKAQRTMKKCYSGWNGTIKLESGLRLEHQFNELRQNSVRTGSGGNDSSKNLQASSDIFSEQDLTSTSVTSSEAAYDLFESRESADSSFSRNGIGSSAFVGLSLNVPIYSREVRLNRKEATNRQVNLLADLYAQYEGHRATAAALTKEVKVLKRIMLDGGAAAIQSYYEMLSQIAKSKALMTSSKRKILTMLEACDYVE